MIGLFIAVCIILGVILVGVVLGVLDTVAPIDDDY